ATLWNFNRPPGLLLGDRRRPSAPPTDFGPVFTPRSSSRPCPWPPFWAGFRPVFLLRRRESSYRPSQRSFARPKVVASVPPESRTVEADAPPSLLVSLQLGRHRR